MMGALDAGNGELLTRYQRAQYLDQGKIAFNTTLYPHWIGNTDHFWYQRDSETGHEYRLVDAGKRRNEIAFDHEALAKALKKASGEAVVGNDLPLGDMEISVSPRTIAFSAFGKRWRYDDVTESCSEIDSFPANWKISPDGCKALFRRDHNLWVRDLVTNEEHALTRDGERLFTYGSTNTVYGWGEQPPLNLEAIWSPDSRRIFTQVIDTRQVKRGTPLIRYVPGDGTLRPEVIRPDRRVAWPDDQHIEAWQFLAIELETGEIRRARYRPCPVYFPHYLGYFTGHRGWWCADSRRAYFTDLERGGKSVRLVEFDTFTGQTRVLIEETSDWFALLMPGMSHLCTLLMPLSGTNELIWYSHRSGWAHFYLYDLDTGKLKNTITQGDWVVRNGLHLDEKRRELTLQTAARVAGRNPYYCDICRVNIDTGELTTLISSDHEYYVCDERAFGTPKPGVSPTGNYIVTTRSRVDQVPVSLLLDRNSREIMTLETADVSGLPPDWQWPEPVLLKAADGTTDIYGVVFRPSDFCQEKTYPVLDCSFYHNSPVGSFTNNAGGDWIYLTAAAYAELGMIAVVIFGRGNDYLRNKAFNSYRDPVLPLNPMYVNNYNKADCVAGIKQLAERYPYMDVNHAGVVETNTVATALCGMLIYPEFYKVGVTRNSNANWRMMGSMGMQGGDEFPLLEEFAKNLQGKLLLVSGMLDTMVPVSMTFRMVEALQRANKDFDMLVLPEEGHMASSYVVRRTWDYLVEHLLGEEPPPDFRLQGGGITDSIAGEPERTMHLYRE